MSTTTTLKPHTRNVTRVFRQANADDRAAGRDWYGAAHDLAATLADAFEARETWADGEESYTPDALSRAAAVIAVLSPRLSWPRNVQVAWQAYETFHQCRASREQFVAALPVLNRNAGKAWDILSGTILPDDALTGPKTRAFWQTIADPYNALAVVVDRHAIDVALGQVTNDVIRGKALGRKGAYDALATCYRRAARIISLELGEHWTPAAVQAVTWTYWRRTRAAAYHGEA
jgi:hypothetical protein